MPLTGEALNEQGNAITRGTKPTNLASWITFGITAAEVAPEETTGPAKKLKKAAHGLSTGDVVVPLEINGNSTFGAVVGGLMVGFPYRARSVAAGEFALAYTKTQSESATEGEWVEFTETIKATTKFAKVTEHTGAKTKRKETPYAAAANLVNEYATPVEVEASSAATAKWEMKFSAETVGTLMAVERLKDVSGANTEKVLAEADILKINSTKVAQTGLVQ